MKVLRRLNYRGARGDRKRHLDVGRRARWMPDLYWREAVRHVI